jgi:hypothetical protein
MENRFAAPHRPVPRGREEGKILPFRPPVGGVLMHPGWRWAAAGGVIVVGSCLGIVSLAPHWFFPRAASRADGERPRRAATEEESHLAVAESVVSFREVSGASRYRVTLTDVRSGALVFETEPAATTIALPAAVAAELSPGGAGELRVEALSSSGRVVAQWTETVTLDRRPLEPVSVQSESARPAPSL